MPTADEQLPTGSRELPKWLWTQLREDPTRAPEHLALAAHQVHGPAAQRWAERRRSKPDRPSNEELALIAKRQHVRAARVVGASTGLGGYWTVIPDLAGLAWIQARMVFCIAAAYEFDPLDRMRPAELLVLMDLFGNPYAARDALDGAGTHTAVALVTRGFKSRDQTLMARLATMAGKRAGTRYGGKLIPGVAVAVNAIGNGADTKDLADKAMRFYGG